MPRHALAALMLCCVTALPTTVGAALYTLDVLDDATRRPGDAVSFHYSINDANSLATVDLLLPYDPLVLKFLSASSPLLTNDTYNTYNAFDNGTAVSVSGTSVLGLSGNDQTLVTINFTVCTAADCVAAAPAGAVDLLYGTVGLSVYDNFGAAVTVDPLDIDASGSARLTVAAAPLPAAWLLLLPGLAALAAGRRR